ncbi:MAG: hypothetical protein AAF681_09080 [Pseudomonadota bacterium]
MPPDLRPRMDVVLGARQIPRSADMWTELRDWLEAHEVKAPEGLPVEQRPDVGGRKRIGWMAPAPGVEMRHTAGVMICD